MENKGIKKVQDEHLKDLIEETTKEKFEHGLVSEDTMVKNLKKANKREKRRLLENPPYIKLAAGLAGIILVIVIALLIYKKF